MTRVRRFRHIDINCRHCGVQLRARRLFRGAQLDGLHDLEYRHVGGDSTCTRTYQAQPFDGWRASAAYDKAAP